MLPTLEWAGGNRLAGVPRLGRNGSPAQARPVRAIRPPLRGRRTDAIGEVAPDDVQPCMVRPSGARPDPDAGSATGRRRRSRRGGPTMNRQDVRSALTTLSRRGGPGKPRRRRPQGRPRVPTGMRSQVRRTMWAWGRRKPVPRGGTGPSVPPPCRVFPEGAPLLPVHLEQGDRRSRNSGLSRAFSPTGGRHRRANGHLATCSIRGLPDSCTERLRTPAFLSFSGIR